MNLEKCYQCSVNNEISLYLKVCFCLVTCKINNLIALRSTNQITEISTPWWLELKLEQIGTHTTLLDLDTKIENGIFLYKLFHKKDNFKFLIVCMPHFERNVESTIFYESVFFVISSYSQMYTETGAFSTQCFRTLFKNAITSGKSKLHQ